jgi:PAS domain S-box-containing protein
MRDKEKTGNLFNRLRYHSWVLASLWTGCIAASLLWNLYEQREKILEMARKSAQITFENDVLYRRWAARQGGVYVPVSEHTPPNPYLHVPDRDMTTSSGLSLTLVNPAYMIRQVNEMAADIRGSQSHLTSLKPIRPENSPDPWETAALKSFERGVKEVSSVEKIADEEYMRLMRPFVAEKACLKCHALQGYKEGDIRGGISVSVPMAPLSAIERPLIKKISLAHLLLWIVGMAGIVISKRGLQRQIFARERAEAVLSESENKLRIVADFTYDWEYWRSMDDRFLYVSPSCERITGHAREEFIRDPGLYSRIIHPDDRERVLTHLREDRFGQQLCELEFRIVRRDGQERWIGHACQPVLDANGQSLGRRASDRDITGRKRMEQALRESEEDLNRAQAVAQTGSWRLNVRRNELLWSDETYRIFGIPVRTPLTYETFLASVHLEDRECVDQKWAAALRGETYDMEHRIVVGDAVKWVRERAELEFNKQGVLLGGFGTVQDITAVKQAEQTLQQRTLELQQLTDTLEQRVRERTEELADANKALRQLSIKLLSAHEEERKRIAGELHDTIGACLSGIKFKVEDTLQRIGRKADVEAKSLEMIVPVIQEAVEECRRIQMDLRPSMLDDLGLLPTLSWFSRRFQTIYSGIRVDQEVRIEESEVPDSLKTVIYRVTQEALNNVAKHSKADLARLRLRKIDGGMEVTVEDNGQGFDLEKALDAESARRGLGLTSMRERTELSGGSFHIESIEGKGTIIRARWPL